MLDQCVADTPKPRPRPAGQPVPSRPQQANRQQGKTTTLSKFIAALAIGSIAGGNLCFVYSTGLDRAQEVVKASRAVIDWLRTTPHVERAGYEKIKIARDNERMVGSPPSQAVPGRRLTGSPATVRHPKPGRGGQRGRSAAEDGRKLPWGQPVGRRRRRDCVHKEGLVLPLPPAPDAGAGAALHLQWVQPAALDGSIPVVDASADPSRLQSRRRPSRGRGSTTSSAQSSAQTPTATSTLNMSRTHSPARRALTAASHNGASSKRHAEHNTKRRGWPASRPHPPRPPAARSNLGNLPPWKSIMKLSQIKRLYPKKQQREFETEILGIPEDEAEGYINGELLEALRDKPRFVLDEGEQFAEVWVGVDPLSHGRSEMGLAAIAYSNRGEKIILGTAAVPTLRPQLVEVREAIKVFLDRIRDHPGCALAVLVPIVEWCGVGSCPPAPGRDTHTRPDPPAATTTRSTPTSSSACLTRTRHSTIPGTGQCSRKTSRRTSASTVSRPDTNPSARPARPARRSPRTQQPTKQKSSRSPSSSPAS